MDAISTYLPFILLATFVLTYLCVSLWYVTKKYGVFQAPFIFATIGLLIFLPQFSTIIYNHDYDNELLNTLTYTMVTGLLALVVGFESGKKHKATYCLDINLKRAKPLFLLFFIIGLYGSYKLNNRWIHDVAQSQRTATIIFSNLIMFLNLSLFYALIYVQKYHKTTPIIRIMVIAVVVATSIYIVKWARRADTFRLVITLMFFYSLYRYKHYKYVRFLFIVFIVIGTVLSASVGVYRHNKTEDDNIKLDIIGNYKKSYKLKDIPHGLDLGNAAKGIDYCKTNRSYNLGTFIWNDFIQMYVPRFIVGQDFKEGLKFKIGKDAYDNTKELTKDITTMTSFYDSFAAFGHLGFVFFFLSGWIMGFIWIRAFRSSFYLLFYMLTVYYVPNLATHGFSFLFGNIEMMMIFIFPLLCPFIFRNKQVEKKKAFNKVKKKWFYVLNRLNVKRLNHEVKQGYTT